MKIIQARQFFMLSGVDAHIMASCEGQNYKLTLNNPDSLAVLDLSVLPAGAGNWIIKYEMLNGNRSLQAAVSDPIPTKAVQGCIAAVINDAFSVCEVAA